MSDQESSCFPDIVFEEMALGRLDPDLLAQVEEHLSTCRKCTARNQAIRAETHSIQGALRSIDTVPKTPCINQITLALYVDGTMTTEDHDAAEEHLSTCRSCQERLIELHHTIAAVTNRDFNAQSDPQQASPMPILDLPQATPAITPQASESTWLQSLQNLNTSWPLILASLIILAAGAAQFSAPNTITPQLQLLIATSAAFIIHDKLRFHVKKILPPEYQSERRTGLGTLTFWTATTLFVLSFFAQGITSWCLTLSLIAYLTWLFGRTIPSSLPAQAPASLQGTQSEADPEKLDQQGESFIKVKESHK